MNALEAMASATQVDVMGFVVLATWGLLIVWRLALWQQRRAQVARRQVEELRRQELLQRLTFFLSSLRHVYSKYPAELLPPALQQERQTFLEEDFRNLTSLSALSLSDLEGLYANMERECATGKWRGGVQAIEQRVEAAVRQHRPQPDHHQPEAGSDTGAGTKDGGIDGRNV